MTSIDVIKLSHHIYNRLIVIHSETLLLAAISLLLSILIIYCIQFLTSKRNSKANNGVSNSQPQKSLFSEITSLWRWSESISPDDITLEYTEKLKHVEREHKKLEHFGQSDFTPKLLDKSQLDYVGLLIVSH